MNKNLNKLDYLKVLEAIRQVPFNIGKNLLIDFLSGNLKNDSITRNRLQKKAIFGYFELYSQREIEDIIENLLHNDLIEYRKLESNRFIKVISITEKGKQELAEPSLHKKKLSNNFSIAESRITNEDMMMFDAFDFFLKSYNEQQKKAIVSGKCRILCIAGAGSGKTTVLTKRVEFLTTFKSVRPGSILAITFTRKARTDMLTRISRSQYCSGVMVETFNSFCEKVIKQHNDLIYGKFTRVITFGEKIRIFKAALRENNIDMGKAIVDYFSSGQRRDKSAEELANMLMADCFTILEAHKSNNLDIEDLKSHSDSFELKDRDSLDLVYRICKFTDSFMKRYGLRDYSDQITHCIDFFKKNPGMVPNFEHILVDEYQDVNSSQIELLEILNPKNLFCVGDPRQSIFGWRGSKMNYILNFEEKNPDSEIITLNTNYRSSKDIVELINKSLENSRLPELNASNAAQASINLLNFDSEDLETDFVVQKINELNIAKNQIFVLARTNRMINNLSRIMKEKRIRHLVKTDDFNRDEEAAIDEVVLATIHSIKGLEANTVFVIGCTSLNFPCKASDHPIMELVRMNDYDKEEEERRLFYVALSRAKNELYLTYSGKSLTRFVNPGMLKILNGGKKSGIP